MILTFKATSWAAAALTIVTLSAVPAKAGCEPTADQAAVGMRVLQSEFMIAGLKCGAEQWNAFNAKFQTTLKKDGERLTGLFRKTYMLSSPGCRRHFPQLPVRSGAVSFLMQERSPTHRKTIIQISL